MAVTACSDTPTGPGRGASLAPGGAGPRLSVSSSTGRGKPDPTVNEQGMQFTVSPGQALTVNLPGGGRVDIPADAVCDPATSGYSDTMWDSACDPAQSPITFTVTFSSKHGHAYMSFTPDVRFAPSSDPSRWVMLTLKDVGPLSSIAHYGIIWQRPWDGKWVNEAAFDATLAATTDLGANTVARRLKHFSGYNISTGEEGCDPILNPDWCLDTSTLIGSQ